MDPEIWKLALKLVEKRGMAASDFASERAKNALEDGDEVRCQLWCWIKLHVDEFLKGTPDEDESMH